MAAKLSGARREARLWVATPICQGDYQRCAGSVSSEVSFAGLPFRVEA
jgi:hypothetical protein